MRKVQDSWTRKGLARELNGAAWRPRISVEHFIRRTAVPQYEFLCKDCKKPFSKILSMAAYDTGKVTCPECGSSNVEQQLSPFYAVTSKKSAA